MTGFLANVWLRTHQASFDLRRDAGIARPRLVAVWEIGSEGRPVCRWKEEDNPHERDTAPDAVPVSV